jgi:hypothetical protein
VKNLGLFFGCLYWRAVPFQSGKKLPLVGGDYTPNRRLKVGSHIVSVSALR